MTSLPHPFIPSIWTAFRRWMANALVPLTKPSRTASRPGTGLVSLVGAGPGSADLITLRGLQRLQQADVVFYDRLADPALLDRAPHHARLVDVGKAPGRHTLPQDDINAALVQAAQSGLRVVRLKCGDPGIFGRGAEEAAACAAADIPCEVIPGVTSACAAAAAAGSFLTERGQTDRLILMTGHKANSQPNWTGTATEGTTLALYMGVSQASEIAMNLIASGWPNFCEVEVVAQAQTKSEKVLRCRLDQLGTVCGNRSTLGPAMILVRWPHAKAPSHPSTGHSYGAPMIRRPVQATGGLHRADLSTQTVSR